MVEKLSSVDPISLARVHRGSYYLTSGKLKGSRKCRKVKVMKNRKKKSRESGRTTTQHVMTMEMTMRRKHHDLSQCAMCKRWMWQHRTDYEECNTTHTLTCSCCASCWLSGSWFWRCNWCRTPQRQARWFYSSTAFYHANATPNAKFFPSGCCSPIVPCHRSLNLYTKFLHISHLENGSFWGVVFTLLVGYSRPPSTVNDPSATK